MIRSQRAALERVLLPSAAVSVLAVLWLGIGIPELPAARSLAAGGPDRDATVDLAALPASAQPGRAVARLVAGAPNASPARAAHARQTFSASPAPRAPHATVALAQGDAPAPVPAPKPTPPVAASASPPETKPSSSPAATPLPLSPTAPAIPTGTPEPAAAVVQTVTMVVERAVDAVPPPVQAPTVTVPALPPLPSLRP